MILEGDLEKVIIRFNLLIAVGSPNSLFVYKFRELSNLILEGDIEKPSLGAICLLQSVFQIQSVSHKNSGGFDINLILEGDLEKPSLDAICLLQSVPQIQIVSQKKLRRF